MRLPRLRAEAYRACVGANDEPTVVASACTLATLAAASINYRHSIGGYKRAGEFDGSARASAAGPTGAARSTGATRAACYTRSPVAATAIPRNKGTLVLSRRTNTTGKPNTTGGPT